MNDPTPIESLLKLAGERDQPPAEGLERARAAARQSWQGALSRPAAMPAPRSRRFAWAWAAAVLAVVAVPWWLRDLPPAAVEVARVSAVDGEVRLGSGAVTMASVLRTGEELTTAEGRVALAMGDALSLRVDRRTRLRFDRAGHITLLEGAVYVDSGGLNAHAALHVATPAGVVRHVGTQFQVAVRARDTRVQVREGRVVLEFKGGETVDLGAGDLADLDGGKLAIERGQPASGAAWEWAAATAPPFDIENRPLSEFLAWLAREHGWQLRFADAATQSQVQGIRLHGSMSGLDAAGMLERASLITGVRLSVREDSLLVGVVR